jgi:hypothetical protein
MAVWFNTNGSHHHLGKTVSSVHKPQTGGTFLFLFIFLLKEVHFFALHSLPRYALRALQK